MGTQIPNERMVLNGAPGSPSPPWAQPRAQRLMIRTQEHKNPMNETAKNPMNETAKNPMNETANPNE